MATISIDGTDDLTLTVKDFSEEERRNLLQTNVELFAGRRKAWNDVPLAIEVSKWSGVDVKMHVDEEDPNARLKKEQLRAALSTLEDAENLQLPGNKLEVFIHDRGQACLGYLMPIAGQTKAVMLLGNGVLKVSTDMVGTRIRDEFKSGDLAASMQARTAILHEFGHILHQCAALDKYAALAAVFLLKGKSDGEAASHPKMSFFLGQPSRQSLEKFAAAMTRTARPISAYASSHPNEFVAETFAALMMDVEVSEAVRAMYDSFGGPPVPEGGGGGRGRRRANAILFKAPSKLDDVAIPVVLEQGDGL